MASSLGLSLSLSVALGVSVAASLSVSVASSLLERPRLRPGARSIRLSICRDVAGATKAPSAVLPFERRKMMMRATNAPIGYRPLRAKEKRVAIFNKH